MRTVSALLIAASAVVAQEVGFTGGASLSDGTNAISNPNVNNGMQWDSSLVAGAGSGSSAGPTTFNDIVGSSFTNVNSNAAIKDNLVNNPSFNHVKGNDGWTANGDSNSMGPVQNLFGADAAGFRRRGDVVFADNHHQVQSQVANEQVLPAHVLQSTFVRPGFVSPVFRRGGDVVFADNHHQVQSQVANVQGGVPSQFHPGFVSPAFGFPQVVASRPLEVDTFAASGRVVRRDADITFANNQHDAQFATANFVAPTAFAPQFATQWVISPVAREPVAFRPVVEEVVSEPAVVANVVAPQQSTQKATIVQNQA
ncbi:hypothetical protein LPJ59_001631 [Coemansia sp. RSA 2399]|nr:hypothetical protein LPJ59_001631 [Coemansia sp. RSA 2399]KAJ1906434.1 hypothetical protein LPJ81_001355 [Coemansia sp. IMI 209127]